MKTLTSLVMLAGVVALGCTTTAPSEEGTVENVDESLITCSTNNGKWPMAAAFAVAVANEIGEIDVVRDFYVVNGQTLGLNGNARCYSNGKGCTNILGILALQDPAINKGPNGVDCSQAPAGTVCLNQMTFNATSFGTGLVTMRADQMNKDADIQRNSPAKWAELAAGHALVPTLTFNPTPVNACNGVHYYFKAYKRTFNPDGSLKREPLAHPEYLVDRLWSFGGPTSNPYLAFASNTVQDPNYPNDPTKKISSRIAIDPDDTGNRTPSVGADCLAYNLNKVFDPTHKLVTAKTCCKMVEDSSGGYLQSGIGSNMFYDFCVKDSTPPSCTPTNSTDYVSGTALNTTGPVCVRTNATIAGWGCSNFDGRTLKVNGNTKNCGDPMPAKAGDGYYYLDVSAGAYAWAGIYWW